MNRGVQVLLARLFKNYQHLCAGVIVSCVVGAVIYLCHEENFMT